jgi:hypothetical protein
MAQERIERDAIIAELRAEVERLKAEVRKWQSREGEATEQCIRAGANEADAMQRIASLEADLAAADRALMSAGGRGDHACVNCYPHSGILIDGFECAFHAAKRRTRTRELAKGGK